MTPSAKEVGHARALLRRASTKGGTIAVVFHADADGTAAAALAVSAIAPLGGRPLPLSPPKGENVFGAPMDETIRSAAPSLALVLDTGSRAGQLFPGVPTVVVDHHPTAERPAVAAFVSDVRATSTSLLALDLLDRLAPLDDRLWIAAVGALGDARDAPRREPLVAEVARIHGSTLLREVVSLVNAAGRSASHEPLVALEALVAATGPKDVLERRSRAAAHLYELREEVAASLRRARRAPPHVLGGWALVRIHEPCRIHGVLASTWARRLAPRIVVVANEGYVSGRVHIAARCHADVDVRAALQTLLPNAGPDYAAGHAKASGGIVDVETYRRFRAALERERQRPRRDNPAPTIPRSPRRLNRPPS